MSKVNKKFWIVLVVILIIGGFAGGYYFTQKNNNDFSLSFSEKKWSEDNKNKLIDLSVLTDVPLINDNGSGIFFDFLNDLEKKTGLEFNKIPYTDNEDLSEYALKKVHKASSNDLVLYKDNYSLISKEDKYYFNAEEIKGLSIGILKDDKNLTDILKGANITEFDSKDALFEALENGSVENIALPKTTYLEDIIKKELNIVYNIEDYYYDYVITLGKNKELNQIFTKYFDYFKDNKYQNSFDKYLADSYFKYNNIDEKTQTKFRSKRYIYGFVLNAPYSVSTKMGLKGINYSLLNSFEKMATVEIDFKKYSSIEKVTKAFDSGNIDLIINNDNKVSGKTISSADIYDGDFVIIADDETDVIVSTVKSLDGKTVSSVKDSKISNYLKKNNVKVKEYDNINALIKHLDSNSLAAIDEYSYDYYVRSGLKTFKKLKTLDLNSNYNFILRDNKDNELFNDMFNFYVSFINTDDIINKSYKDLLNYNNVNNSFKLILSTLAIVLVALIGFMTFKIFGRKKKYNGKLSKADKLRFVDALTSLKNRNYLNENIPKWDGSEVYPQAIVMVDLNNIAYINDNFGYAEGDKVIVEGAGILIKTQLSNSELIRTNGNEFLVFLTLHDEKSIVAYIRKLNKEFKELSHGFGAAIGYSMITDEIKTIDDAINEATNDMKNNKEEIK